MTLRELSRILFLLAVWPLVVNKMCPTGYFFLENMTECHAYLNCSHLSEIRLIRRIGYGAVKNVDLGRWKNYSLAYSTLRNNSFVQDFKEGVKLFKLLSPSRFITQLIGFCDFKNVLITEYHELNNANNGVIRRVVDENPKLGLKLCLNYARILKFIHNSQLGVLVNCDSNSLPKALSQILITRNWKLILNDLDALPIRRMNSTVECGRDRLAHNSLPPESSLGCTEQCDVWKLPDVCNYFLSGRHFSVLQYAVFDVHRRCKTRDPRKRPSSSGVVELYKSLIGAN